MISPDATAKELRLEVALLLGNSHHYPWALGCTDEEYANKEIAMIRAKRQYAESNDHRLNNLANLYQQALKDMS
jgi:hypothetical protein